MNTPWLRRLLDLEVIPANAENLRMGWEHPWPGWAWALLILAAAAFAFWSYSRLTGGRVGRMILASSRFILLVLLLVIVAGPVIELPREHIEEDWVLVLADRSESMTIADAGQGRGRTSRDAQLRETIENNRTVWDELEANRHLVWLGFHTGAFDLALDEGGPAGATPTGDGEEAGDSFALPVLGDPTGWRTMLSTSIEQALQRAAARPLSGIVVLSDGRTPDPPTRSLLKRLQAQAAEVFVVPLGSEQSLGDLAIRRVDAPQRAFVRDKVPVTVELDRSGSAATPATVRLIDTATGRELDSREINPSEESEQVTLTAEPGKPGEATWQVVIDSDRADLIPENNLKPFSLQLIDRPLRVLYIEGYPRWEYRYFKNLLIREKSIDGSVMLLSADRDFAQEGNAPITRLPRTAEEFAEFDVIVLGDVPATFFTPQQRELIRDQIAEKGSGLLWIGGERATPSTYAGTVLGDLLPIRGSLAMTEINEPVNMQPTALADRLGVLRLVTDEQTGWPESLVDPATGWSQLWYAQRIEPNQLKPTAEALAQTTTAYSAGALPLVIHMRYGAGQTIYVATDEIWRWRYGRGEHLPEQFWIQMVRMLGRESVSGADDPATLEISPRRIALGQPVRISLDLSDSRLAELGPESVAVTIETEDGEQVTQLELGRGDNTDSAYAQTYLPDRAGQLTVRVDEPTLAGFDLQETLDVFRPDDELRQPETDHDLLAGLAAQTGGRVVTVDELDELSEILPNRAVKTESIISERIWNTPLAFILVLTLITFEWIGRKLMRLV